MVTRVTNESSDKEYPLCPEGVYKCRLEVQDCEVRKKVEDGSGKLITTDEKIPGVRFMFRVEGEEDCNLMRSMKNTTHEKGSLIKFMREYSGNMLKHIKFHAVSGFASDNTVFYDTLELMQDCFYMVTVVHNEYNGKTYANIEDAEPTEEKVPLKEGQVDTNTVDFEDDDIPF